MQAITDKLRAQLAGDSSATDPLSIDEVDGVYMYIYIYIYMSMCVFL